MGRIVLIGGGVRSGKSAYALAKARELPSPRIYVATAEQGDGEMASRAQRHRQERGTTFETIEEPRNLRDALNRCDHARVVVIDCLTLWLSNRLLAGESPDSIVDALEDVLAQAAHAPHATVIVTNEVGMGIVPETALGRQFRDLAGAAHQAVARTAAEIYLATLGVVVRLHPAPVEISARGGIH